MNPFSLYQYIYQDSDIIILFHLLYIICLKLSISKSLYFEPIPLQGFL